MNVVTLWHDRGLLLAFSSAVAVVILGLMLFMSYRLIALGRRKAYRTLLISLGIIAAYHLFQLITALHVWEAPPMALFGGAVMRALAFILLNFAVFELYYKRRPRTRAWLFGLFAIGVTIAVCDVFVGTAGFAKPMADSGLLAPVLDGYMLVLSPLFALMFGPHLLQSRRYVAGLAFAFGGQLALMAGAYWGADSPLYAGAAALLPVGYYILLFMLLFERVVELLQSAYRSSITDGLTNLFNRRFFMGQLDYALRAGKAVGAIFCDIDNFKKLNDTQGHQQADVVLKQVAAILMEETEGIGLAGRYGGEELVAFVSSPDTSSQAVAELIRSRVAKETIVTVSVGHCTAEAGMSGDQLMKRADEAMYHSKRSGKNRVTDYAALAGADDFGLESAASGRRKR
ncbi:GGDEF domain-containing protein [Cohnella nanjingensis]|uniref:GGDEF domain-containing protein n=1 Tax=Cohnella nanjingensis TaxID=1387779 RepID=A0A7X0RXL8_9BACL|nr:GGDEF domain-containing protein [Cohnella nanjingensis]MBB6674341.1 GGDEF domain-containing protein [Cohnella nanjingensis]